MIQYLELRQNERSTWAAKGQLKGAVSDHEKVQSAIHFLRTQNINTIADLTGRLDDLEKTAADTRSTLKKNEKRYQTISSIERASETICKYKPIHDAYMKKGFKMTKERYAEAHKDELDAYNKAYRFLMKVNGSIDVDLAALDAERQSLSKQDLASQAVLDSVKADLEQLRTVRYYVSRVMPDKIEPKSIKEKLAAGKAKADRENAERSAQQSKKQNIEI